MNRVLQGNLLTGRFATPRTRAPKERELHFSVARLIRTYGHPDWRFNHPGGGELRDARTGAKLKRMGLAPGRPDFECLSPMTPERPGGLFHGLELRIGRHELSESQESFAAWCASNRVPFAVARSFPEALEVLGSWGALRIEIAAAGAASSTAGVASLAAANRPVRIAREAFGE